MISIRIAGRRAGVTINVFPKAVSTLLEMPIGSLDQRGRLIRPAICYPLRPGDHLALALWTVRSGGLRLVQYHTRTRSQSLARRSAG